MILTVTDQLLENTIDDIFIFLFYVDEVILPWTVVIYYKFAVVRDFAEKDIYSTRTSCHVNSSRDVNIVGCEYSVDK